MATHRLECYIMMAWLWTPCPVPHMRPEVGSAAGPSGTTVGAALQVLQKPAPAAHRPPVASRDHRIWSNLQLPGQVMEHSPPR
jgi:hypothetical protein